jgi:phosphatidylglycerophosphatase C
MDDACDSSAAGADAPLAAVLTGRRQVAAFDFDGTLTRRDNLVPFLVRLCGLGAVSAAAARSAGPLLRAGIGSRSGNDAGRDAAKAAVFARLLSGRRVTDVQRAGAAHAAAILRRHLRGDVVAKLLWHRRQGHEVVVVSASLDVYVEPVARALGADCVLCTRLESDAQGRLTGRMLGPNVRGAEKVVRLCLWLEESDGGPAEMWGYGDSDGDRELLAAVDHPRWV